MTFLSTLKKTSGGISLSVANTWTALQTFTHKIVSTDTDQSLYEYFNALTTPAKQHYVSWCMGSVLDPSLTATVVNTGTVTMSTTEDNGIQIKAATTGDSAVVNWNTKNTISPTNSFMIWVMKFNEVGTNNYETYQGMSTVNTIGSGIGCGLYITASNSKFVLWSVGSGGFDFSNSSINADSDPHSFKVEITTTPSVILTIDGVVAVTELDTDAIPNASMQVMIGTNSSSDNVKQIILKSIEVRNR